MSFEKPNQEKRPFWYRPVASRIPSKPKPPQQSVFLFFFFSSTPGIEISLLSIKR